jgi:serpin B
MTMQSIGRVLLASALLATGCTSVPNEEFLSSDEVRDVSVDVDQLAHANNELGWDVYRQLTQGPNPVLKDNVLISPYSLASALAITYAGAKGKTANEMARVMHLPGGEDVLPSLMQWVNLFQGAGSNFYTLSSANAAWISENIVLRPEYQTMIEKATEGLKRVNYQDSDVARGKINKWVLDRTNGKIKDLLPKGSITAATTLTLVNALYLKADWQHPFKKESTQKESFFLATGQAVSTDLMHQQDYFKIYNSPTFDAIELPYVMGSNSEVELALRVYLPQKADGLAKLEQHLINEGEIAHLPQQWDLRKVALTLPKFKIEVSAELAKALEALGMKAPFIAGQADFSGIDGTRELVISDVIQKTFIEVDEKGTEAAAATAVVLARMALARPDEIAVDFRADHPFLFTLVDKKSGTILFLGRLVNPKQ